MKLISNFKKKNEYNIEKKQKRPCNNCLFLKMIIGKRQILTNFKKNKKNLKKCLTCVSSFDILVVLFERKALKKTKKIKKLIFFKKSIDLQKSI